MRPVKLGLVCAAAAAATLVTGCGTTAPADNPTQAAAKVDANADNSAYATNRVDLYVVPHAIFMVNADAADAAAGTPTGNTKQPTYKVGDRHDIIAPSTFVVKAGQTITLTAWNYDDGQHSMTLDDPSQIPGFNFIIAAGKKNADGTVSPTMSTVTFTAPSVAKGKILDIAWYCAFPCDGPDHRGMLVQGNNLRGYDGIMAGHIVVMA